MSKLGNPPPGIQVSASRCAVRGRASGSHNGARRQGFATPRHTPPRPCFLRAVVPEDLFATDGSAGNQIQSNFFVLRKTRTR